MNVHNHGPYEGRGLDCGERRIHGHLRGWCMDDETPATDNATGAQGDETPTSAHPDRPTSAEPLNRRTLNLAESHAHEADRLAESRAGLTHALLAHFWLNHARTEQA